MALFSAKRHTWDFPESVDFSDFSNPLFEYLTTYDLHASNAQSVGICWDGTYFYVADLTPDRVYKYDSSWVYQSYFSLHANNLDARAIESDGTYLYVVDFVDHLIYKYTNTITAIIIIIIIFLVNIICCAFIFIFSLLY